MRRTLALFAVAFSMLMVALILGLPKQTVETPDPVPPDPITDPVPNAAARATANLGDVVKLEAALESDHLLAGTDGRVSLLMDLYAKKATKTGREPLAVAVVIDRSGSMAGDKIRQVRRSAKALVNRLSDADQVAIVTYASDYSVDLPLTKLAGQRARITRIIDDILDGGGTNLAGGMQAGLTALRSDRSSHIRRLILLSDGNANQGITDPTSIAEIASKARHDGITISTLGVGVDFNEDLMTLVAQSGAGGYYYARDASAVAAAFEKELSGLVALAARRVEVGLEVPAGVSVTEVYGYRTEMRGGRLVIPVGDMTSEERRRIMVTLDVSAAPAGSVDVANLVLAYRGAETDTEREHRASLAMVATTDHHAIDMSRRAAVTEAFATADAAQAREEAAAKFIAGDRASALRRVKKQVERLKRQNAALKSKAIQQQIDEIDDVLTGFENVDHTSDEAKDLVKSEKLRARQVFVY